MARLILDTGVVIAGVRGQFDVATLADADDVAIAAVSVAEYLAGTLLDSDPGRAGLASANSQKSTHALSPHEDPAQADHSPQPVRTMDSP